MDKKTIHTYVRMYVGNDTTQRSIASAMYVPQVHSGNVRAILTKPARLKEHQFLILLTSSPVSNIIIVEFNGNLLAYVDCCSSYYMGK